MNDDELMRSVIPSRPVVDLHLLDGELKTEKGFVATVQKLCPGKKLPIVFPALPMYFRAKDANLTVNKEAINAGLFFAN